MSSVKDIIEELEKIAPTYLAEKWDNVGLQIGDLTKPVKKVLTTLDINEEVVEEAIQSQVDLIICHHPLIFKGLTSITSEVPQNRVVMRLIQHDIAVYASHTNLDSAQGGMNDWLAGAIGLTDIDVLEKEGEYTVHDQMLPYGIGRVGNLKQAVPFSELLTLCYRVFDTHGMKYVIENENKLVQRIALVGGGGSDYWQAALKKQADVFITADVSYHHAQDMSYHGLALLDIGHFAEYICANKLKELIEHFKNEKQWELTCIASQVVTDPFKMYSTSH